MINYTILCPDPVPCHLVQDAADALQASVWLEQRRNLLIGLDTETNAEWPWSPRFRVRMVQLSDGVQAWCWPAHVEPELLTRSLRDHPTFVAHYSEAEVRFLGCGLPGSVRTGDSRPHIIDNQVAQAHHDPRTLLPHKEGVDVRLRRDRGLKETYARQVSGDLKRAEEELHTWFMANAPKGSRTKKAAISWGFANIPVDQWEYLQYSAMDAVAVRRSVDYALRMSPELIVHMRRDWLIQWDIDRMTLRGMPVDAPYVRWLDDQLTRTIKENTAGLAQWNINPSGQGQAVLAAFARLGIAPRKMTKGSDTKPPAPSWDKDVLIGLEEDESAPTAARQLAGLLNTSRRATKFRSAYLAPMIESLNYDHRVHCSMRAVGTVTHRMSAAKPALQQQPKKDTRVRAAYGARPGWVVVSCDFAQGEPRVMAGLSGDPAYVAAVTAGDVNNATTAVVWGAEFDPSRGKVAGDPSYYMRQGVKQGFLARCYGGGWSAIDHHMHIGQSRVEAAMAAWDAAYPVMFGRATRLNQQEYVTLPSGRHITLWDRKIWWNGDIIDRGRPSRKALNYETQGHQADLLKAAWLRLRDKWSEFLLFFLHDEILLYVPEWLADEAKRDLEEAMTMPIGHGVTMKCEAEINGRTWLPQPSDFDRSELLSVDALDDLVAA